VPARLSAAFFGPAYSEVVAGSDRTDALLDQIAELHAIVLRIARRVSDDSEPMTATQRLALIEIAAVGPIRLRSLARRMETTPATATRAVDALEGWGYVTRAPEPNDRRGVLVAATRKGNRWVDRRRALLRKAITQIGADAIPPRLVDDLSRLNAALREETGHDDVSRGALLAP
jgi:DNA-binding MarR family transcriptional regulator